MKLFHSSLSVFLVSFVLSAFLRVNADELKNGSAFTLDAVPELLTAKAPPKVSVRFSLEENPTYLPLPLAGEHDRLWTRERMEKLIAKAIEKRVAIEIQAESPYPRPKDLSRWLEVIVWLDLKGDDIWHPKSR